MENPYDVPEPVDERSDYQRDWDSLAETLESLEAAMEEYDAYSFLA